jgi:GPH family glycoside/pentoside/hexuronide:cation symporter
MAKLVHDARMTKAPDNHRLTTGLKAAWGLGSIGTVTVLTVNSLLLLFFMTTVLGIAPALAGTLLFAAKLIDAVAAPVLGGWSDATNTRWGRRAPFLLAGAFVCGLGISLVFNPPAALAASTLPWWILGSLVIIALGYTLFNVPYIAMPAEMTDMPTERTSIMSWRIAFVSIGGLITGLAPQAVTMFGGGRTGFGLVGYILAAVVVAAMLCAFYAARRTRIVTGAPQQTGFKRFGVVFQNKPFMLILLAKVFQLVGLASLTASILFLMKNVLQTPESSIGLYVTASTIGTLGAMPIWVRIGKRFAKRDIFMAACLLWSCLTASWLLAGAGEPLHLILLRGFVSGIFTGGLLLMGQSLMPDAIDADCKRSGVRREGVYAGAYSFVEKASMALGPLLVGLILQSFGFQPSLGKDVAQSAEAIRGIYLGAAVMPPILYVISVIPLWFFKLDDEPAVPQAATNPAE